MNAKFTTTSNGVWAYIQKKVRIDGRSTTQTIKRLGKLCDIQREHGCADPRQWVIDLATRMTEEEKLGKQSVTVELNPHKEIEMGELPLRVGGDMLMLPLYSGLGLKEICANIVRDTRVRYDLNEILQTLVMGRILFPGSKTRTFEEAKSMVRPPKFSETDMYRALSLLSEHIDDIQAQVYKNSKNVIERRERAIYYDCTNFFFEIENNDRDRVDEESGEFIPGLRKRGKSKEHRPNPIVQMGMFMDMDGIPLVFVIFPGNESEQTTLQPLEEVLNKKFGLTEYVVSTDCGLGSEDNRRYNMAEGRDYICVQSIPKLKEDDRNMAIDPKGWRISWCRDAQRIKALEDKWATDGIFNLQDILDMDNKEVQKENNRALKKRKEEERQKKIAALLKDVTFFKEIIVTKEIYHENEEWLRQKAADKNATPRDKDGKPIPHRYSVKRDERVIVTYSHDFALYLKGKRQTRKKLSEAIVKAKNKRPRQSQQSPMKYVNATYYTAEGEKAERVEFAIDEEIIAQEEKLDGYYAYGTSLDDNGIDVLRIRSFHHEIEHLFRTTKTHLEGRPVYLSREDRIKSHFLTCFLAMVILKILQKRIITANPETYKENPLSIDELIRTLRSFKFGKLPANSYIPMLERTILTDQLQKLNDIEANGQIIKYQKMTAIYRNVKKELNISAAVR